MSKNISFRTSNYFSNKVVFGFFSRTGGVSKKEFNSLNCGIYTGDKSKNINKNIKLALNALKVSNNKTIIAKQTHSNKIKLINNNFNYKKRYQVDGFVTKKTKLALSILSADCAPIFFYDSKRNVIGAAHSGWRGCLKNICLSVIISMKKLGCRNHDIKAIIGPCIYSKNYDVGKDIYLRFIKTNKIYIKFFKKNKYDKYNFNLRSILKYQLKSLKIQNIAIKNGDTYKNKLKYYSYRRSYKIKEKKTGRMINIIAIKDIKNSKNI